MRNKNDNGGRRLVNRRELLRLTVVGRERWWKWQFKLLAPAFVLVACATPGQPVDEVTKYQQQWTDQKVTHYRYTLQNSCFCIPEARQPVMIEVRDGAPVSVVAAEGGAPVNGDYFNRFDTVDDLFQAIQDANKAPNGEAVVTYDATSELPTNIKLDADRQATDDETFLTISNFEVLQ